MSLIEASATCCADLAAAKSERSLLICSAAADAAEADSATALAQLWEEFERSSSSAETRCLAVSSSECAV
jgi:hypothetical protein